MEDLPVVMTRDRSSGRVHNRVQVGEELLTSEACNLDDAGGYEVVTEQDIADLDAGAFCQRCFPDIAADD